MLTDYRSGFSNYSLRDFLLSPKYWNIETKRQSGSGLSVGNAVGATSKNFRILGTAERAFDAVRLIILNYELANSVQGFTANFAPTANMAVPNVPTGSWTTFTWAGAGFVNLANATPGIGVSPRPIPSLAISDWMSNAAVQSVPRNDGGSLPMWVITQNNPPGGGTFTYSFESQSSIAFDTEPLTFGRRFYKMFQPNVDGVATPASFTTSIESNNCNPFIIQFRSKGRVSSVLFVGDSIIGGSGTTSNMLSAGFLACANLSAVNFPIQFFGGAQASRCTIDSLNEGKSFINTCNPNVAVYQVYSPNDGGINSTLVETQLRQASDFITHCRANDVVPVLLTPTPDNSDSLTASNLKISLRQTILNFRNLGVLVADVWGNVAEFPGANVSNGWGWRSGFSSDGLHPNDVGAIAIRNALIDCLFSVFEANN